MPEPEPEPKPRPLWVLHAQAQFWRVLMSLGMYMHRLAPPRPPPPNFTRIVTTTISPRPGQFKLHFYLPPGFHESRIRNHQASDSRGRRYPAVVNFHGGGFTLGAGTDDARWAAHVTSSVDAIVVSVDYRLAPEHPFPTAVEDGADAVLYLAQHADEFGIDPARIALSGFSAGGNMALTVPLLLHSLSLDPDSSSDNGASASTLTLASVSSATKNALTHVRSIAPPFKLAAIITFYPPTNYTLTRPQRHATLSHHHNFKDMHLPTLFTSLFDESYLQPASLNLSNPLLSPGVADQQLLDKALPRDVVMFTCEFDMLHREGCEMRDRLRNGNANEEAAAAAAATDGEERVGGRERRDGKDVRYYLVRGKTHAWDKSPNPFREAEGVGEQYQRACGELRRIFGERLGERRAEC